VGVGKSVFARGFIRGFMNDPTLGVNSPTFMIIKSYENTMLQQVLHLDLYRIKHRADLEELAIDRMVEDCKHHVLIEWPENLMGVVPKRFVKVEIQDDLHEEENFRMIHIELVDELLSFQDEVNVKLSQENWGP